MAGDKSQSTRVSKTLKRPWERLPFEQLPVSYIAEQCYCEKRVDLWLAAPGSMVSIPRDLEGLEGPPTTLRRAADAGIALHASAAEIKGPLIRTTLQKALRSNASTVLVESGFLAQFDELPIAIAGIPDAVHFERAVARCVVDYKLTDSNQLHISHRVQLLLYGWLLQESGLRLSDALMVSVLVPNTSAEAFGTLNEGESLGVTEAVHRHARSVVEDAPERKNWYVKKLQLGEGCWVRLRIFRYDRRQAKRELAFFSPYWKGERPPIPTTNPQKCRACLYNGAGSCSNALAPYEG